MRCFPFGAVMSSIAKKPSRSDPGEENPPVRKSSRPSLPAPLATTTPISPAVTRPRRTPSKAKLTPPSQTGTLRPRSTPSRPKMPSRPPATLWTRLLVEAGVVDSVMQLGTQVSRRMAQEGLLGLTVTGRGKTAVEAAGLLTQHLGMERVESVQVNDGDVIVVLQDALGPRKGTVTCDIVIPRPLWQATDACRAASRNAASTHIPVMTLRRSALGESGTLLSLLVAPEDVDPGYDVACAVAHMVDVLRVS